MSPRVLLGVFVFALGCGSGAPYCSEFLDATGRPIVYCPDGRQDPVCDYPGETAHFEEGEMGITLVGGERAGCNTEFEVVCPLGTVGEPYCITDPEL
jgi:hypothetical protein